MTKKRTPGGLYETVYNMLTGLSPRSEGKTPRSWARDLIKRAGGVQKAADKAGVSKRTMERWRSGGNPTKQNAEKLKKAQRASRVKESRAQKLRDSMGGGGLSVTATVTVSNDTRTRTLNLGRHLPASDADAIIQALIDYGPEGAQAYIEYALNTHYMDETNMNTMVVENVSSITW